jgi:hypothetical protein
VKSPGGVDIMVVPSHQLPGWREDQAPDLCTAQLRPLLQPGELYRALGGKYEIR